MQCHLGSQNNATDGHDCKTDAVWNVMHIERRNHVPHMWEHSLCRVAVRLWHAWNVWSHNREQFLLKNLKNCPRSFVVSSHPMVFRFHQSVGWTEGTVSCSWTFLRCFCFAFLDIKIFLCSSKSSGGMSLNSAGQLNANFQNWPWSSLSQAIVGIWTPSPSYL